MATGETEAVVGSENSRQEIIVPPGTKDSVHVHALQSVTVVTLQSEPDHHHEDLEQTMTEHEVATEIQLDLAQKRRRNPSNKSRSPK